MSLASAKMLQRISHSSRPNGIRLPPPTWSWLHVHRCIARQYFTEKPASDPSPKQGTLYDMLDANRDASLEDIKSRWYDVARQYHPDVNPRGRAVFERAKRAYETLGDGAKRRMIAS
ncbi:hypothetical protein PLICRDRAFT_439110 [Plicaturopsis crispa FD-325 SS-3]|uniref:J domain-containing protein n=1 Tax=Plicaturopsis crispa FD-325 SS-3 TaxID=944288 RepID=A0A0C9T3A9_PLICR|nr:hypothetical protein PLICRDRAFT_439110 [Plicaturopsis crispa FD-325 SS-3]